MTKTTHLFQPEVCTALKFPWKPYTVMSPLFIAKPFCFPNATFRFMVSLGFLAMSQLYLPAAILFKSWSVLSSRAIRGDFPQTNQKPPISPDGQSGRADVWHRWSLPVTGSQLPRE